MIKKIYSVELAFIEAWDEVQDMPLELSSVIARDGVEWPAVVTTDLLKAHDFFREYLGELVDGDFLTIDAREIEVSDETWRELEKKDKLEYSDYSDFITGSTIRMVSWAFVYNNHMDCSASVLDIIAG